MVALFMHTKLFGAPKEHRRGPSQQRRMEAGRWEQALDMFGFCKLSETTET